MAQDSIDKIINIRFNYKELVDGWVKTSQALDNARGDVQAYKADMKALRKQLSDGMITQEKFDRMMEENRKELLKSQSVVKALTAEQKQYEREIQNNIKMEKAHEGSLTSLRANLNNLTSQYNRLSAAERASSSGQSLAAHIKAQRDAVKEAEFAIGNYHSEVGNYEEAVRNALPVGNNFLLQFAQTANNAGGATNVIKGMAIAVGALVKQLAAFIATPVGAAIAALYAGYKSLSFVIQETNARIQENEELFYKNQKAMSAADAWNAAYTNTLDRMSEATVDTTAKLKTLWTKLKIFAKDVNRLGVSGGIIAFMGQSLEAENIKGIYDKIAEKQKDRNEKYREGIKRTAELEQEIAEARLKSNDKLTYSDAERAKYAREAIEKTKEMFAIKKDIAELDLDIAKLTAEPTKNSEETNNKLAEMEAALIRLNAQESSSLRELQERLNEAEGKASKAVDDIQRNLGSGYFERNNDAIKKWIESQRNAIRREGPALIDEFEKLYSTIGKDITADMQAQFAAKQDEYRNRILNAQVTGGDVAAQNEMIAILQEQIQSIETFQGVYEAMGYSAVQIDNMRLEKLKELQAAMSKGTATTKQGMQESFQAVSQLAGALSGLAEESGASAGIVAMLGMAQAIASMGAALSKAFTTGVTIWDSLAGVASAIAAITTVISQMKTLNSTAAGETSKYRYARGGLVTGPGTGTSDSIPAQLSNGEAVMTARAVIDWGPVLSMMNVASGGNAIPTRHLPDRQFDMEDMLTRAMEKALGRMPSPVVSVRDINKGQRRVKVQDELARYRKKS